MGLSGDKFSKFNQLVDVGSNIHTHIYGALRLCAVEFIDASDCERSSIVHLSQATCRINNVFQTSHDHHITKTDVSFLQSVTQHSNSTSHDDLLFVTQLLVGFFALMRLGELTYPDDAKLRDPTGPSKCTPTPSNSSCLATRPTGSLKATRSCYAGMLFHATPCRFSHDTSHPATTVSHCHRHYGYNKTVRYLPVPSL